MKISDVIQFNERHKWCGCLGVITEVKRIKDDIRFQVGIQIPMQGIAYIFVLESENAIEKVGEAKLMWKGDE